MTELFELVDSHTVTAQVSLARATIWKRVQEGKFPKPIGGRKRACWSKVQILDYLYQLSRYGEWSEKRTNEALDAVHANALNIKQRTKIDIFDE